MDQAAGISHTAKEQSTAQSCQTCRFWDRNQKNPKWGRCRFNPPNVLANEKHWTGSNYKTMLWPDTCEMDWCGKFEPKPREYGFMPDCGGDFCELVTGENKTGTCDHLRTCMREYEKQETDDDVRQSSAIIRDMLLLVDIDVPVEMIMTWTCQQRDQAEDWAAAVHLEASDNDVKVPSKPEFLPPAETEKRLQQI